MLLIITLSILLVLLIMTPLAWKWQLGMLRMGLISVCMALLAGLLVSLAGKWVLIPVIPQIALNWVLAMIAIFAFLAYRFYRDPERSAPDSGGAIVSSADGKVIYIREVRDGTLPVSTKHGQNYPLHELTKTPFYTERAYVVGISMNFLDVHVNRAPIAGEVVFQHHFPGRFGSLRHTEMVFENERATTIFQQDGLQIAVVQIASRLVRQIISFTSEGQYVTLGQRFGAIRFGSQVDMVLPALDAVELLVKPGDTVKAGVSLIASYRTIENEHFLTEAGKEGSLT